MSKSISAIAIIIISIILAGCANDQYAIEKQFWQAKKQAEKIFRNPHASPPNELERVVKIFEDFIRKYPQNSLAIDAEFNIAHLYLTKEEYDKTRIQLKILLDKYSKSEPVCAEAVFLMGNSYEQQDRWDLALQQYKKIMQQYPKTLRGLAVPMYIAYYYKNKYQPDKMIEAYQEAIKHYKVLSNQFPDTVLSFTADERVARCYVELKDWQNAVDTFNRIIETYQGKINLEGILMEIALIYKRELDDKVKAKEALEKLNREYPQSKSNQAVKNLWQELDKK